MSGFNFYFSFLFLLFFPALLSAQLETYAGMQPGSAEVMAGNSHSVFVANKTGLYRSTNNGDSWNQIGDFPPEYAIQRIYTNQSTILTFGILTIGYWSIEEIHLSFDNGETWRYIPLPHLNGINYYPYPTIALLNDQILLTQRGVVYTFLFNDQRWQPLAPLQNTGSYIYTFTQNDNQVWAIAPDMIYRSTDNGSTWTAIPPSPDQNNATVTNAWGNGDTLYISAMASSLGTTRRTHNNGATWSAQLKTVENIKVNQVFKTGSGFTGTATFRLVYSHDGINWTYLNLPTDEYCNSTVYVAPNLYVLDRKNSIWRTDSPGPFINNWLPSHVGLNGSLINSIVSNDTLLLLAGTGKGLYKYEKTSGEWGFDSLLFSKSYIKNIAAADGRYFAYPDWAFLNNSLWLADESASNWANATNNTTPAEIVEMKYIYCAGNNCVSHGKMLMDRLYSSDKGLNWEQKYFPVPLRSYQNQFYAILPNAPGLATSADAINWTPLGAQGINPSDNMLGFFLLGNDMLLLTNPTPSINNQRNLYYSTDQGHTWSFTGTIATSINIGLDPYFFSGNENIILHRDDEHLIYSTDHGQHWNTVPQSLVYDYYVIGADNQGIFFNKNVETVDYLYYLPYQQIHFKPVRCFAYFDNNGNGQRDSDELPAAGVQIHIQSSGEWGLTDNNGNYHTTLNLQDSAADTLTANLTNSFQYALSAPFLTFTGQDTLLEIALQPTGSADSLRVYLAQTRPLLEDYTTEIVLLVKNTGSEISQGGGKLILTPPAGMAFTQILPDPGEILPTGLSWDIAPLNPEEVFSVKLRFQLSEAPTVNTLLTFKGKVETSVGLVDSSRLEMHPLWYAPAAWIIASKRYAPVSFSQQGGDELVFCSGYQQLSSSGNPGPAFVNFLHHFYGLDLSSLKIIAASHPVSQSDFFLQQQSFTLETDHLPDSAYCYVIFSLKTDTAAVHHFFTSTTECSGANYQLQSTAIVIAGENPSSNTESPFIEKTGLIITPNPARSEIWLTAPSIPSGESGLIIISDVYGRRLLSKTYKSGEKLNISDFSSGFYAVNLQARDGKLYAGKLFIHQ